MQILYLGRAPRSKETLPDFREKCRVTQHSRVFRGLTGSQRTPRIWGITDRLKQALENFDLVFLGSLFKLSCLESIHLILVRRLETGHSHNIGQKGPMLADLKHHGTHMG